MPSCRHCRHCRQSLKRQLCYTCYNTPSVRDQYPRWDKYRPSGRPDFYGQAQEPVEPCAAPPGSPAKIAVLTLRASQGETLWHPGDAGFEASACTVTPCSGTLDNSITLFGGRAGAEESARHD